MSDSGDYEPGYPVKLKPHRVRGKIQGYYVYLRVDELKEAIGSDERLPETLYATRTVLDSGTKQILIRIRKERKCKNHHDETHCNKCDSCDSVIVYTPDNDDTIARCKNCFDWWNP